MGKLLHIIGNNELREIRDNCDWRQLWRALEIIKDQGRSKLGDWWGKSPLSQENTASFHMNDKGWFCFSSNKGGGPIELVQEVARAKGGQLNCYQAGEWLVENGLSGFGAGGQMGLAAVGVGPAQRSAGEQAGPPSKQVAPPAKDLANRATGQSLIPYYADRFHPHLAARGITKATYDYLGAGFLPAGSKSKLAGRLVFQIRTVQADKQGDFHPAIVSHIGRAIGKEQTEAGGKWRFYANFHKTLELYNLDKVLCDERARRQLVATQTVILTEGCFDIAALVNAGFYNCLASFGANLSGQQLEKLQSLRQLVPDLRVLLWYDRDKAGNRGAGAAGEAIKGAGIKLTLFDWSRVADERLGDVSELERGEIIEILSGGR